MAIAWQKHGLSLENNMASMWQSGISIEASVISSGSESIEKAYGEKHGRLAGIKYRRKRHHQTISRHLSAAWPLHISASATASAAAAAYQHQQQRSISEIIKIICGSLVSASASRRMARRGGDVRHQRQRNHIIMAANNAGDVSKSGSYQWHHGVA